MTWIILKQHLGIALCHLYSSVINDIVSACLIEWLIICRNTFVRYVSNCVFLLMLSSTLKEEVNCRRKCSKHDCLCLVEFVNVENDPQKISCMNRTNLDFPFFGPLSSIRYRKIYILTFWPFIHQTVVFDWK